MNDEDKLKKILDDVYSLEEDVKYLDLDNHEKADAGGWLAALHGHLLDAEHAIETVMENYNKGK